MCKNAAIDIELHFFSKELPDASVLKRFDGVRCKDPCVFANHGQRREDDTFFYSLTSNLMRSNYLEKALMGSFEPQTTSSKHRCWESQWLLILFLSLFALARCGK